MSKETYRGKHITIHFDGSKCIHSRNCVLREPTVFLANTPGDWIQPDSTSAAAVVAAAHNCPSGAIKFEMNDGSSPEVAPDVNTIHLRESGPYAFTADIELDGVESGFRATLCRCGESKNKPYCDGSHVEALFQATGEPPVKESEPLDKRGGKLKVTATQDGPFMVDGNVEVCRGTGHTIDRTSKAFLCRCGHSSSKPFCDGTHKKIGFKS